MEWKKSRSWVCWEFSNWILLGIFKMDAALVRPSLYPSQKEAFGSSGGPHRAASGPRPHPWQYGSFCSEMIRNKEFWKFETVEKISKKPVVILSARRASSGRIRAASASLANWIVLVRNKDFKKFTTLQKILEEIKRKIIIMEVVFDIWITAWSHNFEVFFPEETFRKPRLGTCGISVSLIYS